MIKLNKKQINETDLWIYEHVEIKITSRDHINWNVDFEFILMDIISR